MAATPESKVKKVIKDWLDTLPDCWYFMPYSGGYGIVGVPDIVGTSMGQFFAIEVKSADGKPTPWQLRTIEKIIAAGGMAGIARTLDEAQAILGCK